MKASLGNSRQTGGDFQSRSCRQTGRDGWWVAKSDIKFTGGKARDKMWMVWGKQIAEIYWLMDHLFFPDDYGPIMENSDWVESGVESLRKWSGQNDLGRRLAELTASECKLTSWGARSRRDDWKNPQMERDQNQKVTKEKWICRARGMTKKTNKTKCKAKGSASSVKQSNKKKRKNQRRSESETIWIKDGREISIVWINEQIYHRCSGDWAAWGSGRLAKVVRGSREGGGRRLRWRRGGRGVRTVSRWRQAGSFLCDGKQEEGKRARQREVIPGRKPLRCSCLECPQRT